MPAKRGVVLTCRSPCRSPARLEDRADLSDHHDRSSPSRLREINPRVRPLANALHRDREDCARRGDYGLCSFRPSAGCAEGPFRPSAGCATGSFHPSADCATCFFRPSADCATCEAKFVRRSYRRQRCDHCSLLSASDSHPVMRTHLLRFSCMSFVCSLVDCMLRALQAQKRECNFIHAYLCNLKPGNLRGARQCLYQGFEF
jgi:hypothetical protein